MSIRNSKPRLYPKDKPWSGMIIGNPDYKKVSKLLGEVISQMVAEGRIYVGPHDENGEIQDNDFHAKRRSKMP